MGELKDADWMQPFWVCTVWQMLTLWRPLTSAPVARPLSVMMTPAARTCMAGRESWRKWSTDKGAAELREYCCEGGLVLFEYGDAVRSFM